MSDTPKKANKPLGATQINIGRIKGGRKNPTAPTFLKPPPAKKK